MNRNIQRLEEMGRQVAEHMGEGPPAETRKGSKDSILRHAVAASKRSRSTNKGWRIAFAAAASIAVILSAISLWNMGPSPISYWVGNEPIASGPGRWIKATGSQPLSVRFENGDNFELESDSALRIIGSDTETISVALDAGKMTARVGREHGSKFSVKAGPYWIYDIGTVFSVAWNPAQMALAVRVEEGLVHIVGGPLPEQGVHVSAGDVFQYTPEDQKRAAPASLDQPVQSQGDATDSKSDPNDALWGTQEDQLPPPTAPRVEHHRGKRGKPRTLAVQKNSTVAPPDEQPEWVQYLASGDHAKAIASAKKENLGDLAGRISQTELWGLSKAARYARDGETAKRLLQYYRERFANASKAKTAAFLIGRVEMELLHNRVAAANWFETYLEQAPGGALEEEALGRLMQIYQRLEKGPQTERIAKQYRRDYSGGLYQKLATSILGE